MKISELIAKLDAAQLTYGDLDVATKIDEFGCCCAVTDFEVRQHNDPSRMRRSFSADDPELGDTFLVIE